jgi:hypothetical protein
MISCEFVMARVASKIRQKIEWLIRRAEGALLSDSTLALYGAHLAPADARERLSQLSEDVALLGLAGRVSELVNVLDAAGSSRAVLKRAYVEYHGVAGVQRFRAGANSALVYSLSVETFPRHVNNVYLIRESDALLLFDCGSGLESSQRDLRRHCSIDPTTNVVPARHRARGRDFCVLHQEPEERRAPSGAIRRRMRFLRARQARRGDALEYPLECRHRAPSVPQQGIPTTLTRHASRIPSPRRTGSVSP